MVVCKIVFMRTAVSFFFFLIKYDQKTNGVMSSVKKNILSLRLAKHIELNHKLNLNTRWQPMAIISISILINKIII